MIKKAGLFFEKIFENTFEDVIILGETIRHLFLHQKKADLTTTQIIVMATALLLLVVVLILYGKWRPNPETVASNLTKTIRIGPFA